MASNCKFIRAEIEESGGAWLSRGAGEHVEACAGCHDFMNERAALRSLVGGLERVEAPGDFDFRLRARMAAAKETKRTRFFVSRFAPGLASYALAAVFVASITAAYYFNRTAPVVAEHATPHQSSAPTQAASTKQPVVEVVNDVNKEAGAVPPLNDEGAGVVRPSKRERRRAAARSAIEPRVDVAERARTEGALEFGLSTSQVIKGPNVKLEVSSEPMSVVLRDEHGTARRLAMRPVSFGAQTPVGKRRELKGTTVADNEGVW